MSDLICIEVGFGKYMVSYKSYIELEVLRYGLERGKFEGETKELILCLSEEIKRLRDLLKNTKDKAKKDDWRSKLNLN